MKGYPPAESSQKDIVPVLSEAGISACSLEELTEADAGICSRTIKDAVVQLTKKIFNVSVTAKKEGKKMSDFRLREYFFPRLLKEESSVLLESAGKFSEVKYMILFLDGISDSNVSKFLNASCQYHQNYSYGREFVGQKVLLVLTGSLSELLKYKSYFDRAAFAVRIAFAGKKISEADRKFWKASTSYFPQIMERGSGTGIMMRRSSPKNSEPLSRDR